MVATGGTHTEKQQGVLAWTPSDSPHSRVCGVVSLKQDDPMLNVNTLDYQHNPFSSQQSQVLSSAGLVYSCVLCNCERRQTHKIGTNPGRPIRAVFASTPSPHPRDPPPLLAFGPSRSSSTASKCCKDRHQMSAHSTKIGREAQKPHTTIIWSKCVLNAVAAAAISTAVHLPLADSLNQSLLRLASTPSPHVSAVSVLLGSSSI